MTPGQSAASGLPVFDPDGGIKGVGVEAEVKYALTRALVASSARPATSA